MDRVLPHGSSGRFDKLEVGPPEQNDLPASRSEKLAELQAALARHQAEQAPPARPSQASIPVSIDKDRSSPGAEDDEYICWSN